MRISIAYRSTMRLSSGPHLLSNAHLPVPAISLTPVRHIRNATCSRRSPVSLICKASQCDADDWQCHTTTTTTTTTTPASTTTSTSTSTTSAQPSTLVASHGASRRAWLIASGMALMTAWQTQCPQMAHAYLVDEEISLKVYERSIGSVVSVTVFKANKAGVQTQQGVGSGFVWSSDSQLGAHIVTNYHVISKLDKSSDAIQVSIWQPGSSTPITYPAQLSATDPMNDLAVLRITPDVLEGAAIPAAAVGTSNDLKIGQSVYAIGSPYGLSSTLSAGVVSGINRSIPSPVGSRIYGAIQTDASINAGNSGGPLLDSSGRVVGVNTATFTRSGSGRGSGVNFALPIDTVRDIVPKLIVYGNSRVQRSV